MLVFFVCCFLEVCDGRFCAQAYFGSSSCSCCIAAVEQRRKSRGFESLVRTTLSGVVDDGSFPFVRKRLLGE